MTGTGTQSDPYIVDNWEDFVTAVSRNEVYVQFSEGGGSIDMNDIAPEGVAKTMIKCIDINGNGWHIRNLHFKNTDAFHLGYSSTTIKDLHFSDFNGEMFSGGSLFGHGGGGRIRFELCSFSGRADGEGKVFALASDDYTYDYFYRCAFKLNCHENTIPFSTANRASPLEYCNIFINCENSAPRSVQVALKNSYLRGNIRGGLYFICNEGPNYNSVVDAGIGGSIDGHGASYYSNILINSEKVTGSINGKFTQVTASQLKDAAYLKSIGFPIKGGTL